MPTLTELKLESIFTKCLMCKNHEINELKYGKLFKYDEVIVHYFCLLFSANLEQNGEDEDGILGFLVKDVKKEISRGSRMNCMYCRRKGATTGCVIDKCRARYHLPCGINNGSLQLFFGEYRSYCCVHRPTQKVPSYALKVQSSMICVACQEPVQPGVSRNTLWAPCCKKTSWFHRECIQRMALNAGYFFKCPICNDKDQFRAEMLKYGIYIPDQDASWETEPNAFEELLERYNKCDAKICRCPRGRTFTARKTCWEILRCSLCGSQGIHVSCSQSQWKKSQWECTICAPQGNKSSDSAPSSSEMNPGPSVERLSRKRNFDSNNIDELVNKKRTPLLSVPSLKSSPSQVRLPTTISEENNHSTVPVNIDDANNNNSQDEANVDMIVLSDDEDIADTNAQNIDDEEAVVINCDTVFCIVDDDDDDHQSVVSGCPSPDLDTVNSTHRNENSNLNNFVTDVVNISDDEDSNDDVILINDNNTNDVFIDNNTQANINTNDVVNHLSDVVNSQIHDTNETNVLESDDEDDCILLVEERNPLEDVPPLIGVPNNGVASSVNSAVVNLSVWNNSAPSNESITSFINNATINLNAQCNEHVSSFVNNAVVNLNAQNNSAPSNERVASFVNNNTINLTEWNNNNNSNVGIIGTGNHHNYRNDNHRGNNNNINNVVDDNSKNNNDNIRNNINIIDYNNDNSESSNNDISRNVNNYNSGNNNSDHSINYNNDNRINNNVNDTRRYNEDDRRNNYSSNSIIENNINNKNPNFLPMISAVHSPVQSTCMVWQPTRSLDRMPENIPAQSSVQNNHTFVEAVLRNQQAIAAKNRSKTVDAFFCEIQQPTEPSVTIIID